MTLGEGSGLVAVVAPLALGGTYNLQFFLTRFSCDARKRLEHQRALDRKVWVLRM